MASVYHVVRELEALYPLRYAEQWDAPGLIVGALSDEVRRIVFAVDPTMSVVDEAISRHADMLICHHPLLFRSVHAVSGLDVHGAIVERLARHHCALWVGHTNADCAYRGVGQAAADAFGLVDQHPLAPIEDPQSAHEVGLGRVGRLREPLPLRDFAYRVAKTLPQTQYGIQVSGDLDTLVSTVAVLPGSGDSLFDEVRASGVDVYVTSDLRHHPATDAMEQARYEAYLRGKGMPVGSGDANIRPMLINTPHSAIESLWLPYALEDVPRAIRSATGESLDLAQIIDISTDSWTMTIH
jgi:dinuclear metal center YbgI/SA1388 family protein